MLFSLSRPWTSFALDLSALAVFVFGVILLIGLFGEETQSEKWKRHHRIFVLLVFVGVGGEMIGGGGEFIFSKRLQAIFEHETNENWNKLHMQAGDRFLNSKFGEILKGKPKGTAEIWYKPNDREAYMFAFQIFGALGSGGAGWNVPAMKPIPSEGGDLHHFSKDVPPEIRYGSSTDVTIKASPASDWSPNGALSALSQALGLGREGVGSVIIIDGDPTLPKDHFVIVVEQK